MSELQRAMAYLAQQTRLLEEDLAKRREEERRELVCAECGRHAVAAAHGWTLRLDVDDELQAFCPECDRREFRHAS